MPATAHVMPGRAQHRATGIFLAALLQVGLIWALVEGLEIKVWPEKPPVTEAFIEKKPATPPPPPVEDLFTVPFPVDAAPPPIRFDTGEDRPTALTPPGVVRPPVAGPADRGPISIMATHTIPPYPPIEARLGHEGTVVLRLTINAQGVVTEAALMRSSGSEALDAAAQAWVQAHWRYQPAFRGGQAAPAAVNVAVEFKIHNAG